MSEAETIRFDSLDISGEVLRAVAKMGFTAMTPVQARTIPVMMAGNDVIAIAPTGTGKTCAFGILILRHSIAVHSHSFIHRFARVSASRCWSICS